MHLAERFNALRSLTLRLIENLSAEDTVVQPVTDVSPPKWHLAHTTWFFENFILKQYFPSYKPFNPIFDYFFNSYYQSQGKRVQRDMRGFHPRPLLKEILEYRSVVDKLMKDLLAARENDSKLAGLVELGIQHEQQHQELLVTDLKYIWGFSPLYPVYHTAMENSKQPAPLSWLQVNEGLYEIGYPGKDFCFDNELPRHRAFLHNFEIASRPVTVGEYLEFIDAGGYTKWEFWLHEGWQWVTANEITAPLYWEKIDDTWHMYTLNGLKLLNANETLTHVSFYEADAFARWKGMRLPTEQEWEIAAQMFGQQDADLNFLNKENFHPGVVSGNDHGFLGHVWEWTNSAYLPYPGFKPWEGGIGEYNGKFMINQMVLRGGSCATPQDHIRLSYRNFFHPHLRWQFTGVRLAK